MAEYLPASVAEQSIEDECRELFEVYGGNGNRLYNNEIVLDLDLSPEEAQEWTMQKLAQAKLAGKLVGIVAGAFDVPQENHVWFLRHARYLLAKKYLQINGYSDDTNSIRDTIESDSIFLVVSIDSDISLDNRKSNDFLKGGVKRPIYGWSTRANQVASHNFIDRHNQKVRHGIADLVIPGGPDYEATILEQTKITAHMLHNEPFCLIDEYIVFDEHPDDITNAIGSGFDPLVIPMELIYSNDPLTGKGYKSSAIIKRIRGE